MLAELQDETCPHCKRTGLDESTALSDVHPRWTLACAYCAGTGHVLRCGDCNQPLELVRPGKWQCVNEYCPINTKGRE